MEENLKIETIQEKFNAEYSEIMEISESSVIVINEWITNGDSFKKLTSYTNYTPVNTSCNTDLINY